MSTFRDLKSRIKGENNINERPACPSLYNCYPLCSYRLFIDKISAFVSQKTTLRHFALALLNPQGLMATRSSQVYTLFFFLDILIVSMSRGFFIKSLEL